MNKSSKINKEKKQFFKNYISFWLASEAFRKNLENVLLQEEIVFLLLREI